MIEYGIYTISKLLITYIINNCDLWHRRKEASLCVFFKIDSLVNQWSPCAWFLCAPVRVSCVRETNSCSFRLLTLDLLRCLGLELCSFRALLFCLVFECEMGCMSLSLLVKVWVLLKLQSIVFFYKVDSPLFLPSIRLFLFRFSFSRDLR